LSSWTAADTSNVDRYVWISHSDNSGKAAYTSNLKFNNSTKTLKLTTNSSHSGLLLGQAYITSIDSNIIFQNVNSIRFGGDDWNYNIWAGLKYDHNSKTVYLGLADNSAFTANSAQGGGTLSLAGINNLRSKYYHTVVAFIEANTPPSTGGWYTIASVSGYFNFDMYTTGGWNYGSPSVARFNICNRNGVAVITQLSGLAAQCAKQIRLGRNSDKNVWDVQIYIPYLAGPVSQQQFIFSGVGTISPKSVNSASTSSYTETVVFTPVDISGYAITSTNIKTLTIFGLTYNGLSDLTVTANDMVATVSEGTSDFSDGTELLTSYASDSGFNSKD
jgi:hypothetical protein